MKIFFKQPKCDFSLKHYEMILRLIKEKYKFSSFLEKPDNKIHRVYMRHDIDIDLNRALLLAEIEHKNEVVSTFFIQLSTPFYNPFNKKEADIIKEIKKLGHYIGLHYNGPYNNCIDGLEKQRKGIIYNRKFKNFISTYQSDFYKNKNIKYISDSNGDWREGCPCKFIIKNFDKYYNFQILTHPIWCDKGNYSIRQHLKNKYLKETITYLDKEVCKNISSYCKN